MRFTHLHICMAMHGTYMYTHVTLYVHTRTWGRRNSKGSGASGMQGGKEGGRGRE